MEYLIVDAIRLADLCRMDTVARTPEEARQAAEEMAKQYGTQVTVLAPVALCDGGVVPRWTQDFPPVPFGWSSV